MKIRVKLFAAAKQLAQAESIEIDLPDPVSVLALRTAITERYPQLAPVLKHALIAINREYAGSAAVIPPNAEVACIPPVSGG